ncbi:MAG: hypothetical protein WCP08_08295 [Prolixibacteraceae bacterium]
MKRINGNFSFKVGGIRLIERFVKKLKIQVCIASAHSSGGWEGMVTIISQKYF